MNQIECNKLCEQLVADCPALDDWLLWYYLVNFEQVLVNTTWQNECDRQITQEELSMLNRLHKKQQDRKSMPKFLFDKIYNKPLSDEIYIETEKWSIK